MVESESTFSLLGTRYFTRHVSGVVIQKHSEGVERAPERHPDVGEDGSEHRVKAGERGWPVLTLEVPAVLVDGLAEAVVAASASWRTMRL